MMKRFFIAALLLAVSAMGAQAARIGDDGLHKEDWFSLTFKDIAEDIQTAKEQNKRLVLIFEQRGCIYCRRMHEELFTDPDVVDYIKNNFMVVQYNMFGDEEVTDLDGEVLTEKTASRKWGFLFTPTVVFLPEDVPQQEESVAKAAVAIMPGFFGKGTFLDMFHWVDEKGYETDEVFQKYHMRMIDERRAASNGGSD